MRNHKKETKVKYEGGATRSSSTAAYDLIPPSAHKREAQRWQLGAIKHGRNNWKGGAKEFILATFNHLESHINDLKQGIHSEDDHLGAIKWAGSALIWMQENKRKEFEAALAEMVGR